MQERPDTHNSRRDVESNGERKVLTLRPLITDREVPLPSAVSASIGDMSSTLQQWLDGEVSERAARRVDDNNVEFWNRISAETSRRSHMQTPALFSERIMSILPEKKPKVTQTLYRTFNFSLTKTIVLGGGLLAAGVYIGSIFLR